MKEIPCHILWLPLTVCLFVRLCVYHLQLSLHFRMERAAFDDVYKQVRSSASQMLGFLNPVLFMFGAALCAARHVHTNIMRRDGF